jgi:D-tyrosyl-tRNA(Tyr) deacylase
MRAVVQRVHGAEVRVEARGSSSRERRVDGELVGSIAQGLLVYLGVGARDTEAESAWLASKVETLRIFEDAREKMSLGVRDVQGALLVVSQFTLYGDVRKGRRPSFDGAKEPLEANLLYEHFCALLRARDLRVEQGRFGAAMRVRAEVDGPVTILIDSDRQF